jgi:hypothetical protein
MFDEMEEFEIAARECEPLKKANHQVNVVRVENILPHTNADNLELILVGGYQCVVRKGNFNKGDLAVYIQPDSVVPKTLPFKFIWENYETEPYGEVPVRRRRITVRKFRKEWSEGLLLPLTDFPAYFYRINEPLGEYGVYGYQENKTPINPGDDVSELLGITHYEVEEKGTGGYEYAPKRKTRLPKTFKGWFWYIVKFRWLWAFQRKLRGENTEVGVNAPRYDVEALKNHVDAFEQDEWVDVTEKIHGSNARYMFLDGHMYAGSHNLWKAPDSKCIWRTVLSKLPWIEAWCKTHEGYALYGEITPTHKGFHYGSEEPQFFAFDIYQPDGTWVKPWNFNDLLELDSVALPKIVTTVPMLAHMKFDLATIKEWLVDGPSYVPGAKNVREGVVVSAYVERVAHNIGRLQLKIVSNVFYERDTKNENLV